MEISGLETINSGIKLSFFSRRDCQKTFVTLRFLLRSDPEKIFRVPPVGWRFRLIVGINQNQSVINVYRVRAE
ncbi:hypothetical protein EB241_17120 [Erwinia psidii]|uniref:Uncharacterized protein n=1 Tax=Erwinia psidii TaxID=69224 RepID=A0A3N6S7M1_9GAMM|nr:hypothetical protein EB241_17120 [Erwinia psidii]